jgi:hypothetical protein
MAATHELESGTLPSGNQYSKGARFQRPKTQKAMRAIPLGPNAIATLNTHKARVIRKGPDDLAFGNRSGGPLRESKVLRNVRQPAAVRLKLSNAGCSQVFPNRRTASNGPFP